MRWVIPPTLNPRLLSGVFKLDWINRSSLNSIIHSWSQHVQHVCSCVILNSSDVANSKSGVQKLYLFINGRQLMFVAIASITTHKIFKIIPRGSLSKPGLTPGTSKLARYANPIPITNQGLKNPGFFKQAQPTGLFKNPNLVDLGDVLLHFEGFKNMPDQRVLEVYD